MNTWKALLVTAILICTIVLAGCSSSTATTPAPAATTGSTPTQSAIPTIAKTLPPTPTITTGPPEQPSPTFPTVTPTVAVPSPTNTPSVAVTPTTPSPTPTQPVFPTTVYKPNAAPFTPTGAQAEIFQYMLSLINQDRQANGLNPVTLSFNAAAQKHAQDMFDNYFISHWGTDGLKPYMRYTQEGGVLYEQENSAYSGWYNKADDPNHYQSVDVKQELKELQAAMMAEVPPNDGHRTNILNKFHTHVNLGIVYDAKRVALVQQFEGNYVEFSQPPTISGNTLSLSGRFIQGNPGSNFNNISVYFDPTPVALTPDQLINAMPNHYGLGSSDPPVSVALLLPPPPPGATYKDLPSNAIIATKWDMSATGQFVIQADITPALAQGKGVYTLAMIVKMGADIRNITTYSVFVK